MTSAEMSRWRRAWRGASHAVWRTVCSAWKPTQGRREAFQLLVAAIAYHINGVRETPDSSLHAKAVPASRTVAWKADQYGTFFDPSALAPFGPRVSRRRTVDYYGGMHLASASLRIPTAVCLLGQEGRSLFAGFLKKNGDIDRNRKLHPELRAFRSACNLLPMPPDKTRVAYYLAVVVAERDRMEHGAESSEAGWRQDREAAFAKLNQCQVIEAQLSLLRLLADDFEALGG